MLTLQEVIASWGTLCRVIPDQKHCFQCFLWATQVFLTLRPLNLWPFVLLSHNFLWFFWLVWGRNYRKTRIETSPCILSFYSLCNITPRTVSVSSTLLPRLCQQWGTSMTWTFFTPQLWRLAWKWSLPQRGFACSLQLSLKGKWAGGDSSKEWSNRGVFWTL